MQKTGLWWLSLSLIIILLDYLTKSFALSALSPYESLSFLPGFDFTLAFNKGAAFSFLGDAAGWQTWMFGGLAIVVTLTLSVWLAKLSVKEKLSCLAISLIIGGALGNLFDRIRLGYVVDFIDWHIGDYHWPIFNIADSAICLGALFIIIASCRAKNS